MADIVVTMGGQSTTFTVTAAQQDRLLDVLKNGSGMVWPEDGQGETIEPTNAQVAKFGTRFMFRLLRDHVFSVEAGEARRAAASGVDVIEPTES